ncbi:MAG: HEAT repeat domain-containing protein [Minicystis sp.]
MARDPGHAYAKDKRPTDELVELYLVAPDTDDGRQALAILHYRGGDAEFAHGARLAKAATEAERVAGADILAQLGWEERTHLEDSVAILLTLLNDPWDTVVAAAAIALGHRHHSRAIQPLIELARHPSSEVRHGVVHGLTGHEDLAAVATLIELTRDPDRDARDWATLPSPSTRISIHQSCGRHCSRAPRTKIPRSGERP